LAIGSVSLFADSIDLLEDTAVNILNLLAVDWSARYRGRMGMVLAGILHVPGVATLWTAWREFTVPASEVKSDAVSVAGPGKLQPGRGQLLSEQRSEPFTKLRGARFS
jgi:Co/Zn/Cd efflux system component